jgi:zinc transporter ZupT
MERRMRRKLRLEEKWSASVSAFYGGLSGVAASALHQIHQGISSNLPEDLVAHVLGDVIAGAIGGTIIFVLIAVLRNWLWERR